MRIFGRNYYKPWKPYKRFMGNWDYRLAGVFDCEVDYSGKTILDAGCNVGIIDYEIAKRLPAFIHGIDVYRGGILAARHIFQGVDVPSRFDVADLTNDRKLRGLLRPSYDIVIMMAVWQHIRKERGQALADRVIATLTERCTGIFIAKTKDDTLANEFVAVMLRHGFRVAYDRDPIRRLFTFVRD
jgi:2-polyprenyl-3-methyl-5-hydroxy-6-metoxy-1,4-benzoquinol methylase